MKTQLGCIAFGPVLTNQEYDSQENNSFSIFQTRIVRPDDIESLVTEYFANDSLGVDCGTNILLESNEDKRAKEILSRTTKDIGGRYETGLLWYDDDVILPPSYNMAKSRLLMIEKKMLQDSIFAEGYINAVQMFIDKGYARKLSPEESAKSTKKTWFLPHFGVVNANKPGKVRVVFDAAAKSNGVSLNNCLMKGPDQYQPLLAILFRFREGQTGVCGDIAEMFPQVLIRKEDRDAQRFLWRSGKTENPIAIYEMVSMTFGAKCSPSSAQFVKNMNALRYQNEHPEAVDEIIENHYVDDYVSSFPDDITALEISKLVKEIHFKGGFDLRSFVSNSKKVSQILNGSSSAVVNMDVGLEGHVEKILGMFWMTFCDCFTFKVKFNKIAPDVLSRKRGPTKRELLGLVMSVYDPFGFVANHLISAKILLQEVWKLKLNWSDAVPNILVERWYVIQDFILKMELLRIPRCYFTNDEIQTLELHCFVDASECALAAVCYLRVVYIYQEPQLAFVIGKTKCCPTKYVSVPRCELQAAVLGSKLKATVKDYHRLCINKFYFWTDSRTVMYWVKSDSRKYKQYVANRISTILDNSESSEWYWVPTKLNPADDGTRGKESKRWILGPCWLKKIDNWPEQPEIQESSTSQMEIKKKIVETVLLTQREFPVINVEKFSDYLKLLRTMAWVFRFINNVKIKIRGQQVVQGTLNAVELLNTEGWLCKETQQQVFQEEYSALSTGKSISRSSKIFKLLPYLDEKKLLRVFGRIDNSELLPLITKRPIILPEKNDLTKLIVNYYHKKCFHQNEEVIICEIRRKFWVNGLRNLVKKVSHDCNFCKIRRAETYQPIMGQLPRDRLTAFVRPFSYTGLDYFGPVTVSIGRRIEKKWVALFTCLTIRAIHLEIADDLSADSCILCLRNFINYRGVPIRIRTDNGTNLVGAKTEIIKSKALFGQAKIKDNVSKDGIEWLFNTPGNPSEGGCWERMVRSVKRVLSVTLKERHPRVETLRNVLTEAMNIVNSRPLTHVPISVEESEPLTPNHFILGTANRVQTPTIDGSPDVNLRKQWRISQQMVQTFWKRWILEYLPTLTGRSKWYSNQVNRPIKENDVVIICDDTANRNIWEKGRVVSLFKDRFGIARKAEVKLKNRILLRPISKLALLEIME